MQSERDLAIVLRSTQYEDRHRIVTALTQEHGQISAMARNCIQSKRFGGSLEMFTASEWIFSFKADAEVCLLTETHVKRAFEELRKDFGKLSLASVFSEIMLRVAPRNEPCPDLFRLHSNALAALSDLQQSESEIFLLNAYLAKMLHWSGNQPRLRECLGCQLELQELDENEELSCIVSDAGWICPQCRRSQTRHVTEAFQDSLLRVTPLALFDFQISLSLPIRQVPLSFKATQKEHKNLYKLIEALYRYHVPGFDKQPLKSLRFFDPSLCDSS